MASAGMGGHQSQAMLKDEWLTPPSLVKLLGDFDLDPCAPAQRPWDTAGLHYSVHDNGLAMPWFGRVWLNPPYGRQMAEWVARLADHGDGIALVFARTDTEAFHEIVWPKASALLFLRGRLHFHHVSGERAIHNSGAPSVLVAYGEANAAVLSTQRHLGAFVDRREGGCLSG